MPTPTLVRPPTSVEDWKEHKHDYCCDGGASFLKVVFEAGNNQKGMLTFNAIIAAEYTACPVDHEEAESDGIGGYEGGSPTAPVVRIIPCNDDSVLFPIADGGNPICSSSLDVADVESGTEVCFAIVDPSTNQVLYDQKMETDLEVWFIPYNADDETLALTIHTSCGTPLVPPYAAAFFDPCHDDSDDSLINLDFYAGTTPYLAFVDGMSTTYYEGAIKAGGGEDEESYAHDFDISMAHCCCNCARPIPPPNGTDAPSVEITESPVGSPVLSPTNELTESPVGSPVLSPAVELTEAPVPSPHTESPTVEVTEAKTEDPTGSPTEDPTESPTEGRTESPTEDPTESPTEGRTESPTEDPTESPTEGRTASPTEDPTESPTEDPTESPTESPTEGPTGSPTESPTEGPTESPTESPTEDPTDSPTESPTVTSASPSSKPSSSPTEPSGGSPGPGFPTSTPSPTFAPSSSSSAAATTLAPTVPVVTANPTKSPTRSPTTPSGGYPTPGYPTRSAPPSKFPTTIPTVTPTFVATTLAPTLPIVTASPSNSPSSSPTTPFGGSPGPGSPGSPTPNGGGCVITCREFVLANCVFNDVIPELRGQACDVTVALTDEDDDVSSSPGGGGEDGRFLLSAYEYHMSRIEALESQLLHLQD
jgi:hypothetical protein